MLHLSLPTTENHAQCIGPLWTLKRTWSSFGCSTLAYLLKDSNVASFEWDPEEEKI